MLVLSRRIGEELHIGDDTVVIVRSISGNRVRLGIQAPREVRLLRGELAPLDPTFRPVAASAAEALGERQLDRIAR